LPDGFFGNGNENTEFILQLNGMWGCLKMFSEYPPHRYFKEKTRAVFRFLSY